MGASLPDTGSIIVKPLEEIKAAIGDWNQECGSLLPLSKHKQGSHRAGRFDPVPPPPDDPAEYGQGRPSHDSPQVRSQEFHGERILEQPRPCRPAHRLDGPEPGG
jgi:hypothetical protein